MNRAVRFVSSLAIGLALAMPAAPAQSQAQPAYGAGRIVEHDGSTEYDVDGKPFFMFGAAFFYDRLPRASWDLAMEQIRGLGFNTLDLYVPWNWHELADGDFDFDGRTNPRRDLREVLRLAKRHGFYLIVRPGPVIRNEWRNGGYPQWLLERPEYGMPLRDVLEGRYPATATLQNAHSDDAAAQWMANDTHMRYASRWLKRALHEFDPVADRVLAVALDDDQGAYIDNQTWPAPHLTAYLERLRAVAQSVTGPSVPAFINTYQMKVTASAPVWAMGNWYQSDAFALGEHDRSQLEFSTALLQTRPMQPLWTSEFQAGWLQQPADVIPRPADPDNTMLALGTMLQGGVRGVVDFPAQDSLAPAGYEAPFSNAFYAWDAALQYPGAGTGTAARYLPTRRFGDVVTAYGPELARTRVVFDATIAWSTSAYDPASMTNADVATLADRTLDAQRACRLARLTCRLIDLRFASDAELARSKLLIVPGAHDGTLATRALDPPVAARLERLTRTGLPVASFAGERTIDERTVATAFRRAALTPVVTNGSDAVYAAFPSNPASGFLTLVNYGQAPERRAGMRIALPPGGSIALPTIDVPPRSTMVVPIGRPLENAANGFTARDRIDWDLCPPDAVSQASGGLLLRLGGSEPNLRCDVRLTIAGTSTTYTIDGTTPQLIDAAGRMRAVAPASSVDPASTHPERPFATPPPALDLVPIRNDTATVAAFGPVASDRAIVTQLDLYDDGFPVVVLENDRVRIVVSPHAGGRAFVFEDLATQRSGFDTVGALRDDVAVQPPLSTTDRIAKYTHQFPAGFFNRPYDVSVRESGPRAVIRLSYAAPDAFPSGATFVRTLTLEPHSRDLVVDASADFSEGTPARQRGVAITSIAVGDPRAPTTQHVLPEGSTFATALPPDTNTSDPLRGTGLYDDATHEALLVVSSGPLHRSLEPADAPHTLAVTADLARSGTTRSIFRYDFPADLAAARAELNALAARL